MPVGRASSKRDLEISIAFETFADSWCASTSGATACLGWIVGWPRWSYSDGAAGVRQAVGRVNLEERVLWVERACESGVGEWARPFLDFSKNGVDRVWRYVIQGSGTIE